MNDCIFCVKNETICCNNLSYAKHDKYPISKGHSLIIPFRHVSSYFDVSQDEMIALQDLIIETKDILQERFSPNGFNIGVNDGIAAGQTIPHLHIHLIPRYQDDVYDPRGGVRWIFPKDAQYWE